MLRRRPPSLTGALGALGAVMALIWIIVPGAAWLTLEIGKAF
ncbi:MAG TPA: hypothetical protein VGX37_03010 [Allosphingosinicella sp.]|jgi:hypothetical protein|nr:hypothetical protein [Allosphingosinicella sp.]